MHKQAVSIFIRIDLQGLGAGATALAQEEFSQVAAEALGFDSPRDSIFLGQHGSFYDFAILEQNLEDSRGVLNDYAIMAQEDHLPKALMENLIAFIAFARGTESAIHELEHGKKPAEYSFNDAFNVQPVEAQDIPEYRARFKARLIEQVKADAKAFVNNLKEVARSQPQIFRRSMAILHTAIPLPMLQRLGVDKEFNINVGEACESHLLGGKKPSRPTLTIVK